MAVLFINRWDSRCGACGRGASPREMSHHTVLSYAGPSEGCGAYFEALSSDYAGDAIREAAQKLRPDLPWRDA